MRRLRATFVMEAESFDMVYGPKEQGEIRRLFDVIAPPQTAESFKNNEELKAQTEIIFSGWGAPRFDTALLDTLPLLRAIFYAAGTMVAVVTPDVWARGITVCSAAAANAVPVAEYTLAMILISLKHGWRLARETRETRRFADRNSAPGCYGRKVGLIGCGLIARALLERLRPFHLDVSVHDPYLTAEQAEEMGVQKVGLDELFEQCDVVSLHAADLPETKGLIRGRHLESMRNGGVFINTSRGGLLRQDEVLAVAARRPDVQLVLDVCDPEPPPADSPLFELPNVLLTPHIAGSVGEECRRMSQCMIDDCKRFLTGKPLKWEVKHPGPATAAPGQISIAVNGTARPVRASMAVAG